MSSVNRSNVNLDGADEPGTTEQVGGKSQQNNRTTNTTTTTTTTPPTGKSANYRSQKTALASPNMMMNTIDSSGVDGYGSDGRPMQPPPTHSMFTNLYDDSESDGSIVFQNQRNQIKGRERFPSFDSMASSGSVVRAPHTRTNQQTPQAPKVTQQNMANVNPQMLPYDQRRKLMKMKQAAEQQQQQQQQMQRDPPQPRGRPDGRYMQYMVPPLPEFNQQQQQPPPYHFNGMQLPHHPQSPQHFVYPPMQSHPMPMQGPLGNYPAHPHQHQHHLNNNYARLSPYRSSHQPPRFDPNRHPPRGRPGVVVQPQTPPLHSLPRGPPRNNNNNTNSNNSNNNSNNNVAGATIPNRDNNLDSSDLDGPVAAAAPPPPPPPPPQAQSSQSDPTTSNNNSSSANPPPPPPPPPPVVPPNHVSTHIRAESTGSVSSLGSQGSIFGYFAANNQSNEENKNGKRGGEGGGGGGKSDFLQMLNPFSPQRKRQLSPQEFHRKNQDFLKKQSKAGPTRHSRQPTPPQHRRLGSMDRPPASRGTHKRLPSIENDDWGEPRTNLRVVDHSSSDYSSDGSVGNLSPSSHISSSEEIEEGKARTKKVSNDESANERTRLLPPGQGSQEIGDRRHYRHVDSNQNSGGRRNKHRSSRRGQRQRESETTVQKSNALSALERRRNSQRKLKKKKSRRRSRRKRNEEQTNSSDDSDQQTSSSSSYDYRQWTRRRAQMLEDERSRLIAQWKAEARAEALASRRQREDEQWHRRLGRYLDSEFGDLIGRAYKGLTFLEAFICNLPLTVGAIAMAIVTLGVVWFKFMEETLDSCEPVQFHSSQCTFPEFPGCFFCDVTDPWYQVGVNFHFACSAVAGVLALSFILKMLLATQVVLDEMSSPTTASPAGLVCMTTVCVFAGRGFIGQILVSIASCIHLVLVIWFIYMALAYHIMPEPSWFPNTVGIGMSAVKTWLYYPMSGHFLMAVSLSLNFFFFPISLIRVALNEKISATVGYMQMSAPAVSLYALTIMAQPSFEQEKPDINRFQRAHRLVYLPCMHGLFVLSCIGFLASVQSLLVRWKEFRKREFSPAHAAFCFPTLSHANAIQAYRAAINSFSNEPPGTPFKLALDVYWIIVLIGGTVVTLWITAKFFYNLPSWTNINVEDEDEPPAPYETTMTLQNVLATGESLVQPFVSPAVLQANETGALVLVRRNEDDSRQRFVRTRKLAALGFEPTLSWSEMERERDLLLEFVRSHPPRRRTRTLSVPGIDFNYGPEGEAAPDAEAGNRARAQTNSPYRPGGNFF